MSDAMDSEAPFAWFSNFESVIGGPGPIGRHVFILAGPSGVGKTSLALELNEFSSRYRPLRNHTTRPPRPSDPTGHFEYLSDAAFDAAVSRRRFVLARTSPPPKYGYMLDELNSVIANADVGFFMFRHSGVAYLATVLQSAPVVFLEADPQVVASHSQNALAQPQASDAALVLAENRRIHAHLVSRGWPCLILQNNYKGAAELRSVARRVSGFLDSHIV